LKQADVDLCCGRGEVIAVSDAVRLAPWATVLYSCDAGWWKARNGMPEFPGERFAGQAAEVDGIKIAMAPSTGDGPVLSATGGNSGYQAILLAVARGHRRLILLGFDCKFGDKGAVHFHGKHREPLRNPGKANFDRWAGWFERLAPALRCLGVEVINCSRDTALTCFPRMPLERALELS